VTRTFVDIHILQTLPPSNVNRDDTGSPKTAIYGGVRRARVSSQAWKRATRLDFERTLDTRELGVRTKRVVELIAQEITVQGPDLVEQATDIASAVLKAAGIKLAAPKTRKNSTEGIAVEESGYLIFLSRGQIQALAAEGIAAQRTGDLKKIDKGAVRTAFAQDNSIDLALFGRMVADVSSLNVDAAAQVAHAISVHAVDNEYDYFTAVDDQKRTSDDEDEDAGAAMIGTVEFNSSTLYRYATVDLHALTVNLGDVEAARRGLAAFLRSFVTSMPTGKQNTFANRTLPDAALVTVRSDQPVSLVGAFEQPVVEGTSGGRLQAATAQLARYATDVDTAYAAPPEAAWCVGVGQAAAPLEQIAERVSLDGLVERLTDAVADRVSASA
jgi:CRISPR system Cascade subunit CasC